MSVDGASSRRASAFGAGVDPAAAERRRAAHGRGKPLVAPRLGDEIACARLERFDGNRHGAVGGDDHHRRVGILLHDPREEPEPLAAVGCPALEIEVEQDRVGIFLLEHRQQFARSAKRLDALEQIAQRESRGERDVGIVVDHDGKIERERPRYVCSATVRKRTARVSKKSELSDWHGACSSWGMMIELDFRFLEGRAVGANSGVSVSGQLLPEGGQ